MIYVGIDDTDMPDTPGTNQLARALVADVADRYRCQMIIRHQLLDDPRVPYTSKNGSASIGLDPLNDTEVDLEELIAALRRRMLAWFIPGSDPGLCVATAVPDEIVAFGQRCQRELVTRAEAEQLSRRCNVFLEGLGGTCGGMIGALAAIGLAATGNDGRVVVNGDWPDDLSWRQPIAAVAARGITARSLATGETIADGFVDVGKHLRPNRRDGGVVLFVEPLETPAGREWKAVRLL